MRRDRLTFAMIIGVFILLTFWFNLG